MAEENKGFKGFLNKMKKTKDGKSRRSPKQYIRETVSELKKVTWPTKKELAQMTGAVLVFVVLMALVIGVIDLGLTKVFDFIVSFKTIITGG